MAPRPAPCRCAAAAVLALALASPAQASPQTLARSLTNIFLAPLDFALSPVTIGQGVYQNVQDIDDSPGVRVVYLVPGYVYNLGVNLGAACIREVSGLLELVPGLILLPFEADLNPLMAITDRAVALVEYEPESEKLWPVRFGINYTIAN